MSKKDEMMSLTLDVAAPDEVAKVLKRASYLYAHSADELDSAWQDKNAGKPWRDLVKILDEAARKADKARARWWK